MPVVFYALLMVLLLISFRVKREDGFLDYNSSNVIKGFLVLIIVFSHILNAFHYGGFMATPLGWFRTILGQLCVSMFFFISGYGIEYSIETKGVKYSKSIFTNRFLRIFFYSALGLLPFFIYSFCLGKGHPIEDYFLAFIGLRSFGNASWFLFAILVCYFLCSVVYLFNWKKKYVPVVLISVSVVGYIFIMYLLKQPPYTWDTIVCFIYGMVVSIFRERINKFLSKKKWAPYVLMLLSIGMVTILQWIVNSEYVLFFPEIAEMWFANVFFCLFFICLTKVTTLKSPILSYLGKASFAIFIMHGLVICCFVDIGTIPNEHLNYLVLFITSVAIGIPFYYIYKLIDKYITNPIVNWNRSLIKKDDYL